MICASCGRLTSSGFEFKALDGSKMVRCAACERKRLGADPDLFRQLRSEALKDAPESP